MKKISNLFLFLFFILFFILFLFFILYRKKENLIVDKLADSPDELESKCLYNNYSDCNSNDLCTWAHSKCYKSSGTKYIY